MQSLREVFDITQEELALYLDTTRTTVARWELLIRSLPPEAGLKQIRLEVPLFAEPTTIPDQIIEAEAKAKDSLAALAYRRLVKCQNKLTRTQKQFESQQITYARCCSAIHLVNTMLPTITTDDAVAKKDINWFKMREYEATEKIVDCGPSAQRQTQSTIRLLQMEIKELQEMLESDNGNS